MNVLDYIGLHGLNEIEENIQIRKLVKTISHLQSVADINDRVSGNSDVYYETFDGTNDMSLGKIDLTRGKLMMSSQGGQCEVLSSGFKVGQEVSIFDETNPLSKRVGVIKSIGEPLSSSCTIVFENHATVVEGLPVNSESLIMCRSMGEIRNNKLYLYPSQFTEHDIRIGMELGGHETYTFISWVEQSTDVKSSSLTYTESPPQSFGSRVLGFRATRGTGNTVEFSWSYEDPSQVKSIHIIKGIGDSINTDADIFTGTNTDVSASYQGIFDNNNVYPFTILCESNQGVVTKSHCELYFVHSDVVDRDSISSRDIDISFVKHLSEHILQYRVIIPAVNTTQGYSGITVRVNGSRYELARDPFDLYHIINVPAKDVGGRTIEVTMFWEDGYTISKTHTIEEDSLEYWGVIIDSTIDFGTPGHSTYIGKATGKRSATPNSLNGWENSFPFSDIKVCTMQVSDGSILEYLKRDNILLKEDGSPSINNTTSSLYVPMVEIPKMYISLGLDGEKIVVKVSKTKILDEYKDYHFKVGGEVRDHIYIACYSNTNASGAIPYRGSSYRSWAIDALRTQYAASPSLTLITSNVVELIQCLYMLCIGSYDYRSYPYTPVVNYSSLTSTYTNGITDNRPFMYASGQGEVEGWSKFLGLENLFTRFSTYVDDVQGADCKGSTVTNYETGKRMSVPGVLGENSILGSPNMGFTGVPGAFFTPTTPSNGVLSVCEPSFLPVNPLTTDCQMWGGCSHARGRYSGMTNSVHNFCRLSLFYQGSTAIGSSLSYCAGRGIRKF